MKKIIAMLLAMMLVASMAACGNGGNTETQPKVEVPASALEILEKVWGSYTEDEKFYVYGGNMGENVVENAPGAFDVTDTDGLTYNLLVPAEQTGNIDGAASMVHGMLANNFTCGVFHVTGDAKAFAEAMKTAVFGNQWMCGMPEKVLVSVIGGEYVLVAFGIGDAINPFETKLAAAYPAAEQLYFEDLAQ
ncbi:MAG: hypothetical protein IJB02_03155 [Oscillospiraceae bacterium]|nr:hypothetical protein [Oscillospiraceae bacterium]